MKIVLVNSTGPMASSVVSAIVEKFGYLNIPIRDIGVHDYFSNPEKGMGFIRKNYAQQFNAFSDAVATGGVNMLDRDAGTPQTLLDKNKAVMLLDALHEKSYTNVAALYDDYKEAFSASIQYKHSQHKAGQHVELSVDFHKHDRETLIAAYQKDFGELVLIHMHREFGGWIESLVSQRFVNPHWRKRLLFILRWEYKRYVDYENKISDCEGLHLDFDDLFSPALNKMIADIANSLGEDSSKIVWTEEQYDLFGKLKDYHSTFTRADVEGKYLSPVTLGLIRYFYNKEKMSRLTDILIYPFYLIDLIRFSIKRKLGSL